MLELQKQIEDRKTRESEKKMDKWNGHWFKLEAGQESW